jgi:glycine cleavage system H protein
MVDIEISSGRRRFEISNRAFHGRYRDLDGVVLEPWEASSVPEPSELSKRSGRCDRFAAEPPACPKEDDVADATYPDELRYHEAHDWARLDGEVATFGVTWHAQDALGDIVYYAPPEVGSKVRAGDGYGELESVKAVSDVIAPLSGEVLEINSSVVESPEVVNADPYGAWLVRVKLDDPASFEQLLTADAYQSLL